MKQRKKRLSFIFTLLVAVAMVISACGGGGNSKNNNSDSGSNSGGTSSTETPSSNSSAGGGDGGSSDLAPYELTLYYPGTPQKDEKVVEEAINKILKEKINATLDIIPIEWGAWDDRMTC